MFGFDKNFFSDDSQLFDEHFRLVSRLDMDESSLALQEYLTGLALVYSNQDFSGRRAIRANIEICTSLYDHIKNLEGNHISTTEKEKYRVTLTRTCTKYPKSSWDERREIIMFFAAGLDEPEVEDRSNMEEVLLLMGQAVT